MSSGAQVSKGPSSACIARQPILTADEKVAGYELFFRESEEHRHFGSADGDKATSEAIDTLNVVGLQVLCDGQLAFLNCSREALLGDQLALLRPQDLVLEIQANVPPDAEVAASCERLKQEGYRIALDNFVPEDTRSALLRYADFIKVDILALPREVSAALAKQHASERCRMVAAEGGNSRHLCAGGKHRLYSISGVFFPPPGKLTSTTNSGQSSQLRAIAECGIQGENRLRGNRRTHQARAIPVLPAAAVLELSAAGLVVAGDVGSTRIESLGRARSRQVDTHGDDSGDGSGMQLIGAKTGQKTPLSGVYDLMIAREAGNWEQVSRLGKELNVSLSFIGQQSNEAMRWAHQITHVS